MKLHEIIEPRLLEKRGFQHPESPSGSGPGNTEVIKTLSIAILRV